MKRILFLCLMVPWVINTAWAQDSPSPSVSPLSDPETAQTGLLVLQFAATGMTDSAARAYSTMIAQNVANTNRFLVTNHEQAEQVLMKESPELLPCFEIGCGIQMAKILGAERVVSGHISLTKSGYVSLELKLVNVVDNAIEYVDHIRFDDGSMDRRLYALAQSIARNTPLRGKILRANNKLAVISMGSNQGISVGDRLVIYKNLSSTKTDISLLGGSNTRRANIGLLTITKVGDHSSEGVYFQKIETPEQGEYVTTYLEKRKQIQLIAYVRKELDTHLRHVFEVEKKIEIRPISIEDKDKNRWIRTVRLVEEDRDYWQMWMVGTAMGSAYFLSQFKSGDDLKVLGAIGGMAYSSIQYFRTKSILKKLVQTGKFKGYLDVTFNPNTPGGSTQVDWKVNF